ncbi:hypothetical protein [Bartonella tamiae]|uniref:TauD/TfdA-like domain-containing protein n=1 Tax=Bartonella tamiae Th239 TaxID=1094558 RepID=J0R5V5_9HYPH|nr:hypothetical protein [Bartonella tamiae]EJF91079.1 hypothetical protein ME5_00411 [Bartonella tamiae Th239]EJF93256.1 hypothetical protein MEG_01470 [Bartonella tamiae Th307]
MINIKEYTNIDYIFSVSEADTLIDIFSDIKISPYDNYQSFENNINEILNADIIPKRFIDFCGEAKLLKKHEKPCITLKGCPIDKDLPLLDYTNPVVDKRYKKKTYVSESFLLIYAKLMEQEPIGYLNVNDGDIFQDIHPWEKLANTQSQKALEDIGFHKDLANHFVRPDWVNILGLRQAETNYVFTSFTRNIDVLEELSSSQRKILAKNLFYTPFDDLSIAGGNVELGDADLHPIIGGASEYDIRIFENRTIGLTPEAQQAVYAIIKLLHKHKKRFRIKSGFFLGEANNESVHAKEVIHFEDKDDLRNRWLQKTVNVADLRQHAKFFQKNSKNLVNG